MIGEVSRTKSPLHFGERIIITAELGSGWKAPCDGFLNIKGKCTTTEVGSWYISEDDELKGALLPTRGGICSTCLPVNKGRLYKTMSSGNIGETLAEFYPLV